MKNLIIKLLVLADACFVGLYFSFNEKIYCIMVLLLSLVIILVSVTTINCFHCDKEIGFGKCENCKGDE